MSSERTFIVESPRSRDQIRSGLAKLGKDGARITLETDNSIEFVTPSPAFALFKVHLSSPDSLIRERKEDRTENVPQNLLPEWIEVILSCPNKNCITGQPKEPTRPKFLVVSVRPPKVQCFYCGRYIPEESLMSQLF